MWPTLRPGDQVTVESTATDHLQPGDWVLLQGREALFLHRFLGFTREGLLLTKGDGHRAPDSPWSPDALRGRVVAVSRQGRTFPVSPSSLRERARTLAHRLLAAAWTFLRHTGVLIFLLLSVSVSTAAAAVTLNSFGATPLEDSILITWTTASETDMAGFHVKRAPYITLAVKNCEAIPELNRINDKIIPSKEDITGASYAFTDTTAVKGATYYYCLEAVETDGDRELHGPVSATLPLPPATQPPPPPPPPPPVTPSPSPSPAPTSTPPTGTPPTPTPTRTPTPTSGSGEDDTPTETLTLTPTQTPTAKPSPAAVTSIPEPDHASSKATTIPDSTPASQLTGATAAPVARTTSIAPTTGGRPSTSPSPLPTAPSTTRSTVREKGASSPWVLILALIIAAGALILLGGWGLWRTRNRK
jgi:hypothetical protein